MIRIKDQQGKTKFVLPDDGEGVQIINDDELAQENEDDEKTRSATGRGSDDAPDQECRSN